MPEYSSAPDDKLVGLYQAGNLELRHAALGELYRRHGAALIAFIRSRTSWDVSEDIAQDTWTNVESRSGGFSGGNFRAWLFTIARNLIIDASRRQQPEPIGDPSQYIEEEGSQPLDQLLAAERMTVLRECLDQLDGVQAKIVLARLQGEGYTEICQRLEIAPTSAHKSFHSAKQQLCNCIKSKLE